MKDNNPIYGLNVQAYNLKLAQALKEIPEFKAPEWIYFVKSGTAKQRPIDDLDFWHKRAASVLRQIYRQKTVGVNRLRTRYGSRKNRGFKPAKYKKASGKIIRVILQQSDAAGFTEAVKGKNVKAGRKLTDKGKKFMEAVK